MECSSGSRRIFLIFHFALLPLVTWAQTPTPVKGIVEGLVQNSLTGQPLENARVKLSGMVGEQYTKTDAAGKFRFTNLKLGNYRLEAQFPGYLPAGESGRFRTYVPGFDLLPPKPIDPMRRVTYGGPVQLPTITADTDGTVRASFSLPMVPQAVITGKVTDPNGVPLAESRIEVLAKREMTSPGLGRVAMLDGRSELSQVVTTTTDDRGEFRIGSLGAGSYYLLATKPSAREVWESSYRETYYPKGLHAAQATPVELSPGKEVRADIQIARVSGVRVAGHVVEPAGQPGRASLDSRIYTNLTLLAPAERTGASSPFTMSMDGSFEFHDVLPGRYTLQALTREAPANAFSNLDHKQIWAAAKPVEITDRDEAGLTIELEPLRSLDGTVTFAEGCTPMPLEISANTFSPVGFGQVRSTVSLPEGKFVLRGLAPAHYSLYLSVLAPMDTSIKLGDIDVKHNGFDVPWAGDATLRILANCQVTPGLRRKQ